MHAMHYYHAILYFFKACRKRSSQEKLLQIWHSEKQWLNSFCQKAKILLPTCVYKNRVVSRLPSCFWKSVESVKLCQNGRPVITLFFRYTVSNWFWLLVKPQNVLHFLVSRSTASFSIYREEKVECSASQVDPIIAILGSKNDDDGTILPLKLLRSLLSMSIEDHTCAKGKRHCVINTAKISPF